VTGNATQTIVSIQLVDLTAAQHRVQPACQQTEHDAVRQLNLQILIQNRQLMEIQKLVLGSKFGAHIVEQSNDQGLKTIFVSSRSSCSRQKTSCVVLMDKVKHFHFCCIICEFLFSEFYSYKYYYLYY